MDRRFHADVRAWWPWGATLAAVAAAMVVHGWPGLAEAAQWDRGAVASGEWWRTVTCHWAHWTGEHLAWDLAAFAALFHVGMRLCPGTTWGVLAGASVCIPLVLGWGLPGLEYYRGLSGVDAALLVLVATQVLHRLRERGDWWGMVTVAGLLAGLAAKILFESMTGRTVFVTNLGAGVVAVPLAHVAGAIAGLVPWVSQYIWDRMSAAAICAGTDCACAADVPGQN